MKAPFTHANLKANKGFKQTKFGKNRTQNFGVKQLQKAKKQPPNAPGLAPFLKKMKVEKK